MGPACCKFVLSLNFLFYIMYFMDNVFFRFRAVHAKKAQGGAISTTISYNSLHNWQEKVNTSYPFWWERSTWNWTDAIIPHHDGLPYNLCGKCAWLWDAWLLWDLGVWYLFVSVLLESTAITTIYYRMSPLAKSIEFAFCFLSLCAPVVSIFHNALIVAIPIHRACLSLWCHVSKSPSVVLK